MRESEIFTWVTRGLGQRNLMHPTARNFKAEAWVAALAAIERPTPRDRDIVTAANLIGRQIASLRAETEQFVMIGNGIQSRMLTVAEANRQFRALLRQSHKKSQDASKDGYYSISMLSELRLRSAAPGVENTVDGFTEGLVDAVPIWLNRTYECEAVEWDETDHFQRGARMVALLSLELTYKILWQRVLWQDHCFDLTSDQITFGPTDRSLDELWACWSQRQAMLDLQPTLPSIYEAQFNRLHKVKATRSEYETVIAFEGGRARPPKFTIGSARSNSASVIKRQLEMQVISHSYVGDFLDAEITLPDGQKVSCRSVLSAWYTITDAVREMIADDGSLRYSGYESLRSRALTIRKSSLVDVIARCCSLSRELAASLIRFLTTNAADPRDMFQKGVWGRPLIDIGGSDKLCTLLPALQIDSPVRRIELWLERGKAEDESTGALRGGNFETRARDELAKSISENPLNIRARCANSALKKKSSSDEEIDLLLQVGDLLVVGELKSFLAPMEPQERYNYLGKLQRASQQAARKAAWLSMHRERILEVLEPDVPLQSLRSFVPLVVVNQSYGLGYPETACSVVDLHYLSLYLGEPRYNAGTMIAPKVGQVAYRDAILYSTSDEAIEKFEAAMRYPSVLDRFKSHVKWSSYPLPMEDGEMINVHNPAANLGTAEFESFLKSQTRRDS